MPTQGSVYLYTHRWIYSNRTVIINITYTITILCGTKHKTVFNAHLPVPSTCTQLLAVRLSLPVTKCNTTLTFLKAIVTCESNGCNCADAIPKNHPGCVGGCVDSNHCSSHCSRHCLTKLYGQRPTTSCLVSALATLADPFQQVNFALIICNISA